MTSAADAIVAIVALSPFAITGGCLLGWYRPSLILGRNRRGRITQ